MYTDETILDYGKHKGKAIKDIPQEYFNAVYKTGGENHLELIRYIENNPEKFQWLALVRFKNGPSVDFICTKRTYATKKAAMDSIVKPTSKTNKPMPIRAYECPYCSGWHLTSKPDSRF